MCPGMPGVECAQGCPNRNQCIQGCKCFLKCQLTGSPFNLHRDARHLMCPWMPGVQCAHGCMSGIQCAHEVPGNLMCPWILSIQFAHECPAFDVPRDIRAFDVPMRYLAFYGGPGMHDINNDIIPDAHSPIYTWI